MKFSRNNAHGQIGLREGTRTQSFSITRDHQGKRRTESGGSKTHLETGLKMPKEWSMNKYFTNLFTTSKPNQVQVTAALSGISRRVSSEMNDFLEMPFTPEEVVEALTQMCPTKALGPDGLPAVFYQKHWQRVKQGVLSTCLHILNKQGDVAPLNHTYIALIPKKGKPRKVIDFRPISLCNVIYRIVAKAIANRLKYECPNLSHQCKLLLFLIV